MIFLILCKKVSILTGDLEQNRDVFITFDLYNSLPLFENIKKGELSEP